MSDRRLQINQLVNGNGGSDPGNNNPHPSAVTNGAHSNGAQPEVYRFIENDRTYYAYRNSCVYPFPCDEYEASRLDFLYHVVQEVALNARLVNADVHFRGSHRPQVLDVGYGEAMWMYDMAQKYPGIDVVGIDLYNNEPNRNDDFTNVSFYTPIDFIQPDWGTLRPGSFDLIRMSLLCGCVPNWAQQYARVLKYLRPGSGWIEHIEIDWMPRYVGRNDLPPDLEPLQHWWTYIVDASTRLRGSIAYREDTEKLLEHAGFRDIGHRTIRIPLHTGSEDSRDEKLRRLFLTCMCGDSRRPEDMVPSFEALSMSLFTRQLGWAASEVTRLCNAVRAAYFDNRGPLYHNIHIWTARKPKS